MGVRGEGEGEEGEKGRKGRKGGRGGRGIREGRERYLDSALVRGLSLGMRSLRKSDVNLIVKLPIFQMCSWKRVPYTTSLYYIIHMFMCNTQI